MIWDTLANSTNNTDASDWWLLNIIGIEMKWRQWCSACMSETPGKIASFNTSHCFPRKELAKPGGHMPQVFLQTSCWCRRGLTYRAELVWPTGNMISLWINSKGLKQGNIWGETETTDSVRWWYCEKWEKEKVKSSCWQRVSISAEFLWLCACSSAY